MKIGLSLSFCIADIINGKVSEGSVAKIIAGTMCNTLDDWRKVEESYRDVYWKTNPDLGSAIMYRLLAFGKVEQPRLEGKRVPHIRHGHWIDESGMNQYLVMGYYEKNGAFDYSIITASSPRDAIDDAYGEMGVGWEAQAVVPYLFDERHMNKIITQLLNGEVPTW